MESVMWVGDIISFMDSFFLDAYHILRLFAMLLIYLFQDILWKIEERMAPSSAFYRNVYYEVRLVIAKTEI